jgi:DNA replication and repair protein RecF
MVKHGELLQNKRRELVEWINFKTDKLQIEYQLNSISADRLEKYREREIEAGFTFVGPQRDELEISCWKQVVSYSFRQEDKGYGKTVPHQSQHPNQQLITNNQQLLSSFGSRGEQRMAVLRLKLLEAKWIEEKIGVLPVILLDDIFSELDEEHEKMVGELIKGRQTIITATEIHKGHYPEAELIALEH